MKNLLRISAFVALIAFIRQAISATVNPTIRIPRQFDGGVNPSMRILLHQSSCVMQPTRHFHQPVESPLLHQGPS